MANILIDTNLFLDMILQRPQADASAKAIAKVIRNRDHCIITANAMTDIYYVAHRAFHDKSLATSAVSMVMDIAGIVPVDRNNIREAIGMDFADFEDAVAVSVAVANNAECIITNNVKDFQKSPIPVKSPSEY